MFGDLAKRLKGGIDSHMAEMHARDEEDRLFGAKLEGERKKVREKETIRQVRIDERRKVRSQFAGGGDIGSPLGNLDEAAEKFGYTIPTGGKKMRNPFEF